VRARDLAITYPSLTPDAPAEAAGLAKVDGDDTLVRVVATSRLIRQLLGAP
jgi:hypothetical protein